MYSSLRVGSHQCVAFVLQQFPGAGSRRDGGEGAAGRVLPAAGAACPRPGSPLDQRSSGEESCRHLGAPVPPAACTLPGVTMAMGTPALGHTPGCEPPHKGVAAPAWPRPPMPWLCSSTDFSVLSIFIFKPLLETIHPWCQCSVPAAVAVGAVTAQPSVLLDTGGT